MQSLKCIYDYIYTYMTLKYIQTSLHKIVYLKWQNFD